METIERSVEVDAPVTTAYNQWTQFAEFPTFMEGVKEVRQIDDTLMHWVVEIAGQTREWDAEIIEQRPDRKVAWQSVRGTDQSGAVTFEPLPSGGTRVTVRMGYEPEGPIDKIGSAMGIADRRLEGDLRRFKERIEATGVESGGWRGSV